MVTKRHLIEDIGLMLASVALASIIVRTNAVSAMLAWVGEGEVLASFFAGLFFTSLFTAAPAMVVLGELAREGSVIMVALVGGLGAVLGDSLLFLFVRDRISADAAYFLRGPRLRRIARALKRRHFYRILPLFGLFFLASPLPDEPALALLGFSSMRTRSFLLLSFVLHAAGILAVGLVARSIG